MAWLNGPIEKLKAEHDLRVARAVQRRLREIGIESSVSDMRHANGMRLSRINLIAGKAHIAVCRISALHKPMAGVFIQHGSQDITALVRYITIANLFA